MLKRPSNFSWALLALTFAANLPAEIISSSLFSFPAKTEYVEYDSLASLRKLPGYKTLRQHFAGKPLEEAKAALGELGIPEEQVSELVVASAGNEYYGMLEGTFNGPSATIIGQRRGFAVKSLDNQLICPGGEMCLVFLEEGLAAFGTQRQLKNILEARQGIVPRLSSNPEVVALFNIHTEHRAPVRGVVWGAHLKSVISDMLTDWSGWKTDWSRLSTNVTAVSYSVSFDDQAHIAASLQCSSNTAASVLVQLLTALGSFQSANRPAGNSQASPSFPHVRADSAGSMVNLQADTPTPAATPTSR